MLPGLDQRALKRGVHAEMRGVCGDMGAIATVKDAFGSGDSGKRRIVGLRGGRQQAVADIHGDRIAGRFARSRPRANPAPAPPNAGNWN